MLTVITGGSGSGKSAFAEDCILAGGEARRIYVATMYPYDEESYRRIDRHRAMRAGKGFETVERYLDLEGLAVPSGSQVLLECMSNLVANEMYLEGGAGDDTIKRVCGGVRRLERQTANLCVVTNEIFSEDVAYQGDTRRYQEYLGEINCQMAKMADCVVEVVYGIPIFLKGETDQGGAR